MNIKKREKKQLGMKAEITSGHIISLILVILGFSLLFLMFFYSIDWKKNIDREVCHESVIFRGTTPTIAKADIPLKCATLKYCVTDKLIGKGDCLQEFGKNEDVKTLRVKELSQIEHFYSEEIIECWSMMGEGKIDLFSTKLGTYGLTDVYPSCVICSRIAFDKDLKLDLSKLDVQKYMATHKMPNKEETYTQYLSEGRGLMSIEQQFTIPAMGTEPAVKVSPTDVTPLPTATNFKKTDAILFMQISTPSGSTALTNVLSDFGLATTASFILTPKVTSTIGVNIIKGGWLTLATLALFGVYQQANVVSNRAVTAGYCGDVSRTSGDARSGCSVVRTDAYDVEAISKYCKNIESIP